jgi:hypothetical protein
MTTNELRERIAAVLLKQWPAPRFSSARQQAQAERLADSVIAELGLRRETVGIIHRHVTEWSTDD